MQLIIGDRDREVKNLHEYLKTFGYIKSDVTERRGFEIDFGRAIDPPEQEDVFDENTSMALISFQSFNQLPVTGILDSRTIDLMSTRRCGNPDIVEGELVDYVIIGRWPRSNLSYRLENFTPDLNSNVTNKSYFRCIESVEKCVPNRL